jgi:hypothetical protein
MFSKCITKILSNVLLSVFVLVLGGFETKPVQFVHKVVHLIHHFWLQLDEARVVERYLDRAHKGGCSINSHRPEMQLKFVSLRENGINKYQFLSVDRRVGQMDEEINKNPASCSQAI